MKSRMFRRALRVLHLEMRITPDTTPFNLAVSNFYQNWNTPTLITANDNWADVPSITGYLGDDTIGEAVNPQIVLTPYATVDVIANQGSNTALSAGGVAEFDLLANPVVALQGDGTADAPNLVVFLNTTGRANISISYNLRDIDGTTDNAVQPVALQYRVGNTGNFVNVPAGYVADATTGPSLATKVTPVSVTLPSAVDNQAEVQVRIITTNAKNNDEWVGVDDILIGSKEFAINDYTTNSQIASSVAVDADGDAIVVWQSSGQDGNDFGIFGQRFDAAGMKVGAEFQVNTYTTKAQSSPAVAVDAAGNAFVAWHSNGQDAPIGFGIYGQRYDAAGNKLGGEFRINSFTTGEQRNPAVAVDVDGDAFVTWDSVGPDGSNAGIVGQRFDAAGMKVGGEFVINTFTTGNQLGPSVAVDAGGNAFVTWRSNGQDGSSYGIYGQRFDAAGMKVGGEFQINTFTTGVQSIPVVAMDADGDAFVVWNSLGQDGDDYGIFGQRFDAAGAIVGGEIQINTYTTSFQIAPAVGIDADGDALVTWQSFGQNASYGDVYAQRYNAAGAKVGAEFQLNTRQATGQSFTSVALDADGDAFVTWSSDGLDGSSYGIFGQRFRSPNPAIAGAAKVSSVQVNDGSVQRSMVTSLRVTFDSKVSFVGSPAAAFTLVNQKTTNAVTLSAAVDGTGTMVTLTFTGGSVDLGGSVSDGRYTLNILAGQFTGAGFDGNGDGTPGDNYTLIGSPTAAPKLFRLFGDADADGTVNGTDFLAFRLAFLGTGATFDYDGDGQVTGTDFLQFRLRFLQTI